MQDKLDIVMYTNADGLGTSCIEHAHRLPFIKGIAKAMEGRGAVLVVLRYRVIPQCWFERNKGEDGGCLYSGAPRQIGENLYVMRPTVLGNLATATRFFPVRWSIRKQMATQVGSALSALNMNGPRVAWMTHPYHYMLRGCAGESNIVYECYDEFVYDSQGKRSGRTEKYEKELAINAILNIATAKSLYDKISKVNTNTKLITNGVMYDLFSRYRESDYPVADELKDIPKPIIGMIGTLYHGYDFDLLGKLIAKRPDWSFVFVGQVADNAKTDHQRLLEYPNFHSFGWRPYEEVPPFLKGFDAAIIPYKVNDWTNTINPNKVYDYFAAGVPVVATPISELQRMERSVYLTLNADDMVQKLNHVLSNGCSDKLTFAMQVSKTKAWDSIAANIVQDLSNSLSL